MTRAFLLGLGALITAVVWAQPAPPPQEVLQDFQNEGRRISQITYPWKDLHITLIRARVTEESPQPDAFRSPYRAWIGAQKRGRWRHQARFDLEGVGGGLGVYIPTQQPSPAFFTLVAYGNDDGKLIKILPSGSILTCKGGDYLIDPGDRYLVSRYSSDSPELSVTCLATGATLATLRLPGEPLEFRRSERHLFLSLQPDGPGKPRTYLLDPIRLQLRAVSERAWKRSKPASWAFSLDDPSRCLESDPAPKESP